MAGTQPVCTNIQQKCSTHLYNSCLCIYGCDTACVNKYPTEMYYTSLQQLPVNIWLRHSLCKQISNRNVLHIFTTAACVYMATTQPVWTNIQQKCSTHLYNSCLWIYGCDTACVNKYPTEMYYTSLQQLPVYLAGTQLVCTSIQQNCNHTSLQQLPVYMAATQPMWTNIQQKTWKWKNSQVLLAELHHQIVRQHQTLQVWPPLPQQVVSRTSEQTCTAKSPKYSTITLSLSLSQAGCKKSTVLISLPS